MAFYIEVTKVQENKHKKSRKKSHSKNVMYNSLNQSRSHSYLSPMNLAMK
jgi:hypothetical protein